MSGETPGYEPKAPDYYGVLGVSRNATPDEIKAAWRTNARKFHPEAKDAPADAEEKFKKANDAWQVLSNPKKRKVYDQLGSSYQDIADPSIMSEDWRDTSFSQEPITDTSKKDAKTEIPETESEGKQQNDQESAKTEKRSNKKRRDSSTHRGSNFTAEGFPWGSVGWEPYGTQQEKDNYRKWQENIGGWNPYTNADNPFTSSFSSSDFLSSLGNPDAPQFGQYLKNAGFSPDQIKRVKESRNPVTTIFEIIREIEANREKSIPPVENKTTQADQDVPPAETSTDKSLDDILDELGIDDPDTQTSPSESDEDDLSPEMNDESDPVTDNFEKGEPLSIEEEREDNSEELTFTFEDSEPEPQSEKEKLEQELDEILLALKTQTSQQLIDETPLAEIMGLDPTADLLTRAGNLFVRMASDSFFQKYKDAGLGDKVELIQKGYAKAYEEIRKGRGDQVLGWEFDKAEVEEVDDDLLERLDEELDTAFHGEVSVFSEEDLDTLLAHLETSTINQIFGVGEADETPEEILEGLLEALNPDDYSDDLKDKVALLKDGLKKAYKEYQAGNGDKVLGLEFKSTSQASETADGKESFEQFLNKLSQMIDGVKNEIHQAGEDKKIRKRYKAIISKIAEIKILINDKTLETTSPDQLKLLESREKVLTDHEKQLELLYSKLPSRRAQFRRVVVRGLLGLGAVGFAGALLFGGGGSDSDSSSYEGKDPSLAKSVPPTAAAEDLRGETKESTRIERSDLKIPAKEINNTTQFEAPNGATIATFEMNTNVISADYDTQGNAVFEVEDDVNSSKWKLVFAPPEDENATGNDADWILISQELINQ